MSNKSIKSSFELFLYSIDDLYNPTFILCSDESKSRTIVNANKKSKDYRSEDNTLRSMRYFKELSKKQIQDLYKMYYFDFKLFDYDITRYFEINKN